MIFAAGASRASLGVHDGGAMRALLRSINLATGAALVAAGLLLAGISWFDIEQAPVSDAFRLIQFHFMFCGAVSLLGAKTRQAGRIFASVSMLFIIGNAVLAWHAVSAGDPSLLWPAGFVLASVVNYAWLLVSERSAGAASVAVSPAADARPEDETLVRPDFGAPRAEAYVADAGRNIIASALQIILSLATIYLGAIYLELLRLAIFEHANISFSNVFRVIFGDPEKSGLFELAIYVIVPVVVLGIYVAIDAALNILVARTNETNIPDLRRDLTREERVFLRDSLDRLLEYLEARSFPRAFQAIYLLGVLGVIASFIAVPVGVVMAEGFAVRALEISRGGGESFYESGPLFAGGAIGGFFAGALLFSSLYQAMGARNPALAEYLFARAGWNGASNGPRPPFTLMWVLARHVRRRLIDATASFDPAAFLYSAFREREGIVYRAALASVAATAVLGAADVARYQRVDEDGVAYSKYFHFVSQRSSFADLDRIELRCVLFSPDDDGNINLGLDYILAKDGEFRIDLLDGSERDRDWLARLEAIDATLSDAGVAFVRSDSAGFLRGKRPSFIPDCAEEIEKRYDADVASGLIRILRVEHAAFPGGRRKMASKQ